MLRPLVFQWSNFPDCGDIMQQALISLVVLLCVNSSGCDFLVYGFGPHPRSPRYSFGFSNAMRERIDDVELKFVAAGHEYLIQPGVLIVEARKEWYGMPDPIPARGTVSWRTADGTIHHEEIAVADRVKDLHGF